MKVTILGCGSALPTTKHLASSQIVEMRGKLFMVDCGEGTQLQLRRSHVGFTKIQAVFISHLHGDHCLGLIGMLSTFGMLGRTASLGIYAPADFEPLLSQMIAMFCPNLEYKVVFHPLNTEERIVVYEDRSLTVETIPLKHRVPCCGFLFREKPTLPHIRRDMIDFYQIPISYIDSIKRGNAWTTPEGKVIEADRLTTPATPPKSYAYCSDTRYIPTLHEQIKGVSLLYHEATYDNSLIARARLYHHSTAGQAAQVAHDAGAGKLLLGHFSARYDDEKLILRDAQAIFPETMLANEGLTVEI